MGIQINGQTDTISATDGSLTIQGSSLGNITGGLNVTSGSVGIGTDNPTFLLQVQNDSESLARFRRENTGSNQGGIIVGNQSRAIKITGGNDGLIITDNTLSQERLRIDSSGNVGIRTTSPTRPLTVAAGSGESVNILGVFDARSADSGTVGNCVIAFSDPTSTAGQFSTRLGSVGDGLAFYTNGSNERMRINSNGVVGIGETDLSSLGGEYRGMDVGYKGSGISGRTGNPTFTIRSNIYYDGSNWRYGEGNTSAGVLSVGGNQLIFEAAASGTAGATATISERMRIDSDGYLKASRDGSYFNVSENNHSFENSWDGNLIARMYHGGSSGNQYGLEITTASDQNDGTRHFFQCVGSSTVRVRFKSSGGLSNYQANDTNLCDEREKKNIEALDSTWDCLKHWELKKFHYNEDADTDDKRYGVIAQQIAPHCPEVIDDWVKQEAKDAVLDDDGNVVTPAVEEIVRMGVKEQQMYWMAIKALQEAQTRIETLEAEVAALKAQ